MLTIYQAIAGSRPAGVEPPRQTPEAPVQAPPVIDAGAILIPGPVSTLIYLKCVHTLTQPTEQPMPGLQQARLALRNSVRQEDQSPVHVMCLLHDKEDQVHLRDSGIPAQTFSSALGHPEGEVQDTFQGSLQSSPRITIHRPNSQSVSWRVRNSGCHCCDNPQDTDAWSQQDHYCCQGTCTCTCTCTSS